MKNISTLYNVAIELTSNCYYVAHIDNVAAYTFSSK